jgi:tight adherence protein C
MNTIQIIYLALIFIAVFGVALVILTQFNTKTLQDRLQIVKAGGTVESEIDQKSKISPWVGRIIELTKPVAKLSVPKEGWENSQLRIRFMNAGYRSDTAPMVFFMAKTVLTFLLPAILIL